MFHPSFMSSPALLSLSETFAITMWDFSWLERRWSGAGYEDWDLALDGLVERGYNAVRIDAYPHLLASDATRTWRLKPQWTIHDWGACGLVDVRIQPHLNDFISKCAERQIRVALSTWFRQDMENQRQLVATPQMHARIWSETLRTISADGLLDSILFVDLCNEWPGWAPFFRNQPVGGDWRTASSVDWMRRSIELLQAEFPTMPFCYSLSEGLFAENSTVDVSYMGLLEPHVWMSKDTTFHDQIGFKWNSFDLEEYRPVVEYAERLYRGDEAHWQRLLAGLIQDLAAWGRSSGKPLVTTECWAIVNYRDWPLLDWGWVKDLCAFGVEKAVETGAWAGIATSNFCGPQFVGMWRDIEWHRRLTSRIRRLKTN